MNIKHLIESLFEDRSQSLVTVEAAGDPTKVDALRMSHANLRQRLQMHLTQSREANRTAEPSKYHPYPYVVDVYGSHDKGEVVHESDGKLYKSSFKCSAKDGKHTVSTGTPTQVFPRVAYDEMSPSQSPNPGMLESFRVLESGMVVVERQPQSQSKDQPTTTTTTGLDGLMESELELDVTPLQESMGEFTESSSVTAPAPHTPPASTGGKSTGRFVNPETGETRLRIITPGWGSTGYYPADMLKRDGPRIFTEGLHMFWNHDTPEEAKLRPEGDLSRLAAVLKSNAYWDDHGSGGAGLYAKAEVKKAFREAVDDLAPNIGVSIRAGGAYKIGEMEGRKGPIIQRLDVAKSTDFVTLPGRGGKILELFESARLRAAESYQSSTTTTTGDNNNMSMTKEEQDRMTNLEESNRLLRERLVLQEAAGVVRYELSLPSNATRIHPLTAQRLQESLTAHAPLGTNGMLDVAAFKAVIQEAIKSEIAYATGLSGAGRPVGMGSFSEAQAPTQEQDLKSIQESETILKDAFTTLGYNEKVAATASRGRG